MFSIQHSAAMQQRLTTAACSLVPDIETRSREYRSIQAIPSLFRAFSRCVERKTNCFKDERRRARRLPVAMISLNVKRLCPRWEVEQELQVGAPLICSTSAFPGRRVLCPHRFHELSS